MSERLALSRWVGVCLYLIAFSAVASEWSDPADPTATFLHSRRLVRQFDFEEAKHNNFEQMPMYWYAIGRPAVTTDDHFMRQPLHNDLVARAGFPSHTQIGFDKPQNKPGEHRLQLELNGGSAGAFLEVGALPAIPYSDYLVTAKVRTTILRHARARLVAYFIDEGGRRIDESVVATDLIQTDGRDQLAEAHLRGDFSNAAWIGMQVELLQPREQAKGHGERHEVFYQEVHGSAFFDDISVWQLPHLAIVSQNQVHVVRAPEKPRLKVMVRDLTSRPLAVRVALYDHNLREVAHSSRGVHEWAPVSWKWEPKLERYGWYLADMAVWEDKSHDNKVPLRVARTLASVLWLPNEPVGMYPADANRFRIVAEGLDQREVELLPQVMDQTGLMSLTFSAWDQRTNLTNVDRLQQNVGDVIQQVVVGGRTTALSLSPVPESLVQGQSIGARSPLAMFRRPNDIWVPYVVPVLMRHGQRVQEWRLGSTDEPRAFFETDLPTVVRSVENSFRDMVPQPLLVVPWSLDQSRRPDVPPSVGYAIDVPVAVMPENLRLYMEQWNQSPAVPVWLRLREPPATQWTHERRIQDLALRMIYSWELQPSGLEITRPWTRSAGRRLALLPDPLLGVFTNVAHRLSGRRVVGHLDVGEGLRCVIFDGPAGGMLAAWNRSAPPEQATIDMFLGSAPRVVDVWGNRRDIPLIGDRHQVPLDATPVFIEGIDAGLALFRSSFKVEPSFIESTVAKQDRVIRFTNVWPYTITGHFTITKPEKWDILPKQHHFSLASGHTATIPIEVNFPVTELAGPKQLVANFDFVSERHYKVNLSTFLKLGLSKVDCEATLSVETDPASDRKDLIVNQVITNRGSEPLALYAFAKITGKPSQERIIPQLKPGQVVVRRFRFEDLGDEIATARVRVGIRETNGPGVLNMVLLAQDLLAEPESSK